MYNVSRNYVLWLIFYDVLIMAPIGASIKGNFCDIYKRFQSIQFSCKSNKMYLMTHPHTFNFINYSIQWSLKRLKLYFTEINSRTCSKGFFGFF